MDGECANPLYLQWIREWLDIERKRSTKGVHTYQKAYDAMKKCPMYFNHPSQTQQLTGIGPGICARLVERLTQHCQENGLPIPPMPSKRKKARKAPGAGAGDGDDSEEAPAPKRTRKKPYVPKLRSGAYAIMIALATVYEKHPNGITKAELQDLAQPHCESSFTAADPGSHYTAWNSMKTLTSKDLVLEKKGSAKRYGLTDEGMEVVQRMKSTLEPGQQTPNKSSRKPSGTSASSFQHDDEDDSDDDPAIIEPRSAPRNQRNPYAREDDGFPEPPWTPDVVPLGNSSESDSIPKFTPIVLLPSTFTVHLVLDNREIRTKKDRDYIENELLKIGVTTIKRSLELGDALWVAKCNDPSYLSRFGSEGDEIMLDHIVERKRLDDLVSSIKDKRYEEQKFRLSKSGVKNVCYLIEEMSLTQEHIGHYEEHIESAIASMQVVDGYFVKKTTKIDETIKHLARMTRLLKSLYEGKTLNVIPTKVITAQNYPLLQAHLAQTEPNTDYYVSYEAFASLASKSGTLTLKDVYLKMLMCTSGVTGAKAMEIQKLWKTPYDLVKAYKELGDGKEADAKKRALISSKLSHAVRKKQIGKAVSWKLAAVWGDVADV